MTLVEVTTHGRLPKDQALRAAAAVEAGSEHPVARPFSAARSRALDVPATTDFEALPGAGATALIKGARVTVGRADLFDTVPTDVATPSAEATTVSVGWDGTARASSPSPTPCAAARPGHPGASTTTGLVCSTR